MDMLVFGQAKRYFRTGFNHRLAHRNVDAALELLERYGEKAWVLAGGMDSFDWLKDRSKRVAVVVDLSQIAALRGIKEVDGGLEPNFAFTKSTGHRKV